MRSISRCFTEDPVRQLSTADAPGHLVRGRSQPMADSRGGGGPAPTGNREPKPIYPDPRTGGITSRPPQKSAELECELEMEAG